MNRSLPLTLGLLLGLLPVLGATPTAAETIARARAHLGGDAALEQVQTLTYRGTFTTADNREGSIVITLKKPARQRLELVLDGVRRVTAINDFEGWEHVSKIDDPEEWGMVLISFDEFRRMRANTWENLFFFRGIEQMHGNVRDLGLVEFDGRQAHKLIFEYSSNLSYSRYFDPDTGELLATINDRGQEIRERGEIMVQGIRFPEEIISLADGRELMRVRFTEIKVNTPVEDSLFEIEPLSRTSR